MEKTKESKDQLSAMRGTIQTYLDGIDRATKDRMNIDETFLEGLSDGEIIIMFNLVTLAKKQGQAGEFATKFVTKVSKDLERECEFTRMELKYILGHKEELKSLNPLQPLSAGSTERVNELARLSSALGLSRIDPKSIAVSLALMSTRLSQTRASLSEVNGNIQAAEALQSRLEGGFGELNKIFDSTGRRQLVKHIQSYSNKTEQCDTMMNEFRAQASPVEPDVDELQLESMATEINALIARHSIMAAELEDLERVPPNLEQALEAAEKAENELKDLQLKLAESMPSYT